MSIKPDFVIPHNELVIRATRSSGAGGQHVNKTSTKIEITWNIETSQTLSKEQRIILRQKLASQISGDGNLRVTASEMRSQKQNRERAEDRLNAVVRRALTPRKKRLATKPTRASKEKRLAVKKMKSEKKRSREKGLDID